MVDSQTVSILKKQKKKKAGIEGGGGVKLRKPSILMEK